jgi:hypothetical protein
MVTIQPICLFQGAQFSPRKVNLPDGVQFDKVNEPGDLGTTGRYKGKPTPFGSASLRFPSDQGTQLREVLLTIERIVASARLAGAAEIELYLGVDYVSQCNFELCPEDLEILGRLKIPLLISCAESGRPSR